MNAANVERKLIRLVGADIAFTGKKELATFDVVKFEVEDDERIDDIDVKVNIILRRRIAQHLLGIYLPSSFIMAISQVN